MDLLADDTGDLAIVDGEIAFVAGQDAIGQHIAFRLRTFLNESRYNQADGVPWTQVIFRPNTPKEATRFILEQVVLGTPGVVGATLELPVINSRTRGATVTGTAVTVAGEVQFSIGVGVDAEV